jgi:3-oxoacyl-[acyl-carrier protein] reductase
VAVVTGGAGEIGVAIGMHLASQGSVVVLVDRDGPGATRAAELISERTGQPAHGYQADVSREDSVQGVIDWVADQLGGVDQLINNAAINPLGDLESLSLDDWDAVMATNLRGPMLFARAATPLWKRAGWGRVVNIGSRTWLSGGPPAYSASKAGLVGLTRSLAVELGPLNVTVNAVAPSTVVTSFTRDRRTPEEFEAFIAKHIRLSPLGRLTTADDVAAAVAFLASDAAASITGEILHVCGGAQLAAAP